MNRGKEILRTKIMGRMEVPPWNDQRHMLLGSCFEYFYFRDSKTNFIQNCVYLLKIHVFLQRLAKDLMSCFYMGGYAFL